ncbi:MAG: hypothetical protein ACKVVP_04220 [Chloroflexota bacterium]
MVLNAKAMEWAAGFGIDSAKLKSAKVKIFGKWYFPDIPANQRLVNLQTGEVETFVAGLRAGTILYVLEDELKQAKLGPFGEPAAETPPPDKAAEPS